MRAMILAAGEGRRLRPLTEQRPKALIDVGGKPLIEYALETVARSGIVEVIINLHHLGSMIREHVGDGSRFGLRVVYSLEETLLGSGGGIIHARRLLGEETFVTLNADTIIRLDLEEALRYHRAKRAVATMVLRKDPRMADYGVIRIDADGRIGRFLDHVRPGTVEDLEPFMYTGVQILEPQVFEFMPERGPFSITEKTYPRMLAAGARLYGHPFEGVWLTVGTPEELQRARGLISRWSLDYRKPSGLC